MFMRRSPFGILVLVGLGILVGAALFGESAAAGLLAAPFIVAGLAFKVALFFLFFGLVTRAFGACGSRGRRPSGWDRGSFDKWSEDARQQWQRRHDRHESEETPGGDDRFDEWHRTAHARQEVDDHVPPVED